MRPVTVIAPTRAAAVDARRYVARTVNNGRGVAAVSVTTIADLILDLVERSGLGTDRRILNRRAREAAVRVALKKEPGVFDRVASQPMTIRALSAASESLDTVPVAELNSASGLAADVARIHQAAMSIAAKRWMNSTDLANAAVRALRDSIAVERLGTVISYALPAVLRPADFVMLEILESVMPIRVIAQDAQAVPLSLAAPPAYLGDRPR